MSVYDVGQARVGRQENEIVKAPSALKLSGIARKVITADAMHPQGGLVVHILEGQGDHVFPVCVGKEHAWSQAGNHDAAQARRHFATDLSRAGAAPCSPPFILFLEKAMTMTLARFVVYLQYDTLPLAIRRGILKIAGGNHKTLVIQVGKEEYVGY